MNSHQTEQKIDILAISPHPDDAELWVGGILLVCKELGYSTGILYLTEGEMGTGGTAEIRKQELTKASEILMLDFFHTMDFKDCQVLDNHENRLKVAYWIRKTRPTVVLSPYWDGVPGRGMGHTDHLQAGHLIPNAVNTARLRKMPVEGEPHQTKDIFFYLFPFHLIPTMIVDISKHVETWMEALKAHESQFYNPNTKNTGFLDTFLSFSRSLGMQANCAYGQALYSPKPLVVNDITQFGRYRPHLSQRQ